MFDNLTALAMGIVIFAITIGVGIVVLDKFGDSLSSCGVGYNYTGTGNVCVNMTNVSEQAAPTNTAWTSVNGLATELGTSGLAGWAAAVIALAVGILFIAALAGKRKY